MGGQKDRQHRITCKALVLAYNLLFVLYQPHAMEVMKLCEVGEIIVGLHRGLYSDYVVCDESLLVTSALGDRLCAG